MIAERGADGLRGASGADSPFAGPQGLSVRIEVTPSRPRVGQSGTVLVHLATGLVHLETGSGGDALNVRVQAELDGLGLGALTFDRIDDTVTAVFPVVFGRKGRLSAKVEVDGETVSSRRVRVSK